MFLTGTSCLEDILRSFLDLFVQSGRTGLKGKFLALTGLKGKFHYAPDAKEDVEPSEIYSVTEVYVMLHKIWMIMQSVISIFVLASLNGLNASLTDKHFLTQEKIKRTQLYFSILTNIRTTFAVAESQFAS